MSKNMSVLCQEYMLFFCLPLSSQPRLNLLSTQQQGRAPLADYSMANRTIAYTLGRGRASIFGITKKQEPFLKKKILTQA